MSDIIQVNTASEALINVYWQDAVDLELDLQLMYIKSGQNEIQNYVNNVSKPEIDNYVELEAQPLVSQIVNEIAEPIVNDYLDETVKPEIDEYVESKKNILQTYVEQTQSNAVSAASNAENALLAANQAEQSKQSAIQSANNAATSEQSTLQSAEQAQVSADQANIWAEGTDEQVQTLGGEHSAKGWANISKNINYTNITNCITKIPQDIKLELNNDTLTLKAGSKVYYPNGTGNFEELTVSSDISRATFGSQSNRIFIICIVEDGSVSSLSYDAVTNSSSGPNEPTNGNYYNTTTNEISSYVNGEAVDRRTFPIAVATTNNGVVSSIEQVFNGVGFMGSTIFVLPGVKGLIPNGRNADGSLNNTEFVVENLLTQTRTDLGNEFRNILINATSIVTYTTSVFSYNEVENYIVSGNNNLSYCDVGKCWSLNGKYVQQNTKMSFRAVDYNDIYIFNTPVASLMAYAGNTAPDGWLVCDGSAINRTTYIDLYNVIGTTYGSGNGSTTFNLPNFLNKTFWGGSSSGSIKNAGLPNITGTVGATALNAISSTGCFYKTSNTNAGIYGSTSTANIIGFNAANSNSIYGSSSTVQPPAVQTLICIKY